jgi:hypothetical protein
MFTHIVNAWPFWAVLVLVGLLVVDRLAGHAAGLMKYVIALRDSKPEERPPILKQLQGSPPSAGPSSRERVLPRTRQKPPSDSGVGSTKRTKRSE